MSKRDDFEGIKKTLSSGVVLVTPSGIAINLESVLNILKSEAFLNLLRVDLLGDSCNNVKCSNHPEFSSREMCPDCPFSDEGTSLDEIIER